MILEHLIIDTEDSLLECQQRHARNLRRIRQDNQRVCQSYSFSILTCYKAILKSQIERSGIDDLENSRLLVLERYARELRRRRKSESTSFLEVERLQERIQDAQYEIESIQEQNSNLNDEIERNQASSKGAISLLQSEIEKVETLNRGIMVELKAEAENHRNTKRFYEVFDHQNICSCD
jgi:hypothetical protein